MNDLGAAALTEGAEAKAQLEDGTHPGPPVPQDGVGLKLQTDPEPLASNPPVDASAVVASVDIPAEPAIKPARPPSQRFDSIDLYRGLACAVMIVTHAQEQFELTPTTSQWVPLKNYTGAKISGGAWFQIVLDALPIPAFAFCMGMGMTIFVSRRIQRGTSRPEISLHYLKRGALLVVVEQMFGIPMVTWLVKEQIPFYVSGPLSVLGIGMATLGVVLPCTVSSETGRLHPVTCVIYLLASAGIMVGCHAVAAWAQQGSTVGTGKWPSNDGFPETVPHLLMRLFLLPGAPHGAFIFPIVPPLAWTAVGATAGTALLTDPDKGYWAVGIAGGTSLALWLVLRFAGGRIGNLRGPPRGEGADNFGCRLFCMSKNTPSVPYGLCYLGMGAAFITGFHLLEPYWAKEGQGREERDAEKPRVLQGLCYAGDEVLDTLHDFGRAPLFFYLVHTYVITFVSAYSAPGAPGWLLQPLISLPMAAFMRFTCRRFRAFKMEQPSDSLWQMF